jgi:hypothetical protein
MNTNSKGLLAKLALTQPVSLSADSHSCPFVLPSVKVSAGCANFLIAKNAQNAKKSTFPSEFFAFFAFFAVIIFGCGVSRAGSIRG